MDGERKGKEGDEEDEDKDENGKVKWLSRHPHIKLDGGESSITEIPIEIFDHNNLVGAIIRLSYLGYLRHFDMGRNSHKELLGALVERWPIELYDDWRIEISPNRIVELIGIDLPQIVEHTPALSISRRWLSLQAPDIYARYKRGELTATQVARFTLLLLFASTFWSNRKERFNPSILKSLENLAHLEEYNWAGIILSRMYDDMCDLSRSHCKLSGTYYFWETWAFEYFRYTRPELIHTDLGLGLVPLAWRWYRSNLHTVRRKKSLKDLRAFFDTCTLEQVPVGLVNQMMELILGMQQELTSSWTHRAFDDQRRTRPRC
ncbi:hypothetical protein JCGZ_15444 [Jatropha curcas]|uniref:Aminotransferase-like plant mobile domain-containing protein n=1 Tax=Jatropha curcas TaxID=180498 RepID=A0A067K5T9_JATCU|nr:hypothetical protein JCGZ_15444 [Jatropha curcas]